MVQARNVVGYSANSTVITVIAATVPTAPQRPVSSLLHNSVTIDWNMPAENG